MIKSGREWNKIPTTQDRYFIEMPELLTTCPLIRGLHHITGVKVLPYHNYADSKYEALGMENTLPKALPTREETDALLHKCRGALL